MMFCLRPLLTGSVSRVMWSNRSRQKSCCTSDINGPLNVLMNSILAGSPKRARYSLSLTNPFAQSYETPLTMAPKLIAELLLIVALQLIAHVEDSFGCESGIFWRGGRSNSARSWSRSLRRSSTCLKRGRRSSPIKSRSSRCPRRSPRRPSGRRAWSCAGSHARRSLGRARAYRCPASTTFPGQRQLEFPVTYPSSSIT